MLYCMLVGTISCGEWMCLCVAVFANFVSDLMFVMCVCVNLSVHICRWKMESFVASSTLNWPIISKKMTRKGQNCCGTFLKIVKKSIDADQIGKYLFWVEDICQYTILMNMKLYFLLQVRISLSHYEMHSWRCDQTKHWSSGFVKIFVNFPFNFVADVCDLLLRICFTW